MTKKKKVAPDCQTHVKLFMESEADRAKAEINKTLIKI